MMRSFFRKSIFKFFLVTVAAFPGTVVFAQNMEMDIESAALSADTDDLFVKRQENHTPLFVKVKVSRTQEKPIRWDILGYPVNKGKSGAKYDKLFFPGEESPWIDIAPFLEKQPPKDRKTYAGPIINPFAREEFSKNDYTLYFSRTPSEKGLIRKIEHRGIGKGCQVKVNVKAGTLETDTEWSAQSLEYAKAAPAADGRRPTKFPFDLGLPMHPNFFSQEAIRNELRAQALIGGTGYYPPPFGEEERFDGTRSDNEFIHAVVKGCECTPDREKIDLLVRKFTDRLRSGGLLKKTRSAGVMDEPAFGVSAVMKCAADNGNCCLRFRDFLKKQGIAPSVFGKESYEEILPVRDSANGPLFYWTVRYRNQVLCDYYHVLTDAFHKYAPGMRTGVNIATELVSNGNMVQFGVDWYLIYNSGALTQGQTEDWSNLSPTKEICGYITDVMRSATRRSGIPFDMLDVLAVPPWTIQTKAFSEIGRGAKSITFFRYGPHYTGASDSQNRRPEVYEAIKNVTFPTGAVEDRLLNGRNVRGDAAMLLSVTGDIRQILTFANPYGRERIWLHLLLSHLGIRTDILSEEDLSDELANYRVLYVCDANIRREFLPPLLRWIQNGGTLVLMANALSADEYDRPLEFDKAAGLQRDTASVNTKAMTDKSNRMGQVGTSRKREQLTVLNGRQTIHSGEKFLFFEDGSAAASVHSFGKGKIVAAGFFPGFAYLFTASQVPGSFPGNLRYPESGRTLMREINRRAGVESRISTSHYLVEATMIDGAPEGAVLTLANWSGEQQTVTVTIADAKGFTPGKCFGGRLLEWKKLAGDTLELRMEVNAGCHLKLNPGK